jgi:trehalose-6-phosphate synthase/Kef-type K+ transport system membrane component KefB
MKRLLGVVLVVLSVFWVRRIGISGVATPTTALVLGFTLIVAMVIGEVLRRFKLPRLTGYLLFGLLVGPYLGNLITEPMARQLQMVNGIATTLIAFIAGLTLNFERLGRGVAGTARLVATTLGVAMLGLFAVAWIAWAWIPVAPEATGLPKLAMVALFVVIVISFSPTMTAAVISETGARGRLSDLVLAIVVISDLAVLILFSFAMQFARMVLSDGGAGSVADVSILVRLAWEIGGAIAFGSLIGALFALYLRYVDREVTLVLLAFCALLTQVGVTQGFEPLLASMAAGMVIQNVAVPQGDALKVAIQRGALPVLVVFFVGIGTTLQLDAFLALGPVALALVVVRLALICLGVRAGLRATPIDAQTGAYVWTGLISQAGITLGLASVLATEFPPWGNSVQMLLVALIAIDELVGPALFRIGLERTGETDASARRPLIVVSNREPYLHNYDVNGQITVAPATGGVAVALDALMRERNGVWIAHGDGSADHALVDAADKVRVPPDGEAYQLRRLWIGREQYDGYYGGFANEGLWPLCHQVDVRPQFRAEDWAAYQDVNASFAAAIDEELSSCQRPETPVFIQDYHLALVAARLRERRPLARTALFWHIPWPYPDRLRICPWRREILAGLLANDLVAFQLERDRRNFVMAVEEELGAEIESDDQRIWFEDRITTVTAAPIGVDYDRIQSVGADPALLAEQQRLSRLFGLGATIVGLGVDRLDYTKGIPERLEALDRVLSRRPELRGRMTFVQIGVPSRSNLTSYGAIEAEIDRRVADVNARHGVRGLPPPVYYHKGALELQSIVALYRLAHFCIVSSLHDGMNLVAKEFVAARDDEDGVLVLSELAGSAQELRDALIINPYDIDSFANALGRAVDMSREERRDRMRGMRRVVAGRNVFGWASDILEGLESLWTKPLQYAARAPEDAPM